MLISVVCLNFQLWKTRVNSDYLGHMSWLLNFEFLFHELIQVWFCRFMVEQGSLVLLEGERVIHLLEAYSLVSSPLYGCSWDNYQVYSYLRKLGYIVGRHNVLWTLPKKRSPLLQDQKSSNSRMKLMYDVHLPNARFKKSNPGLPSFSLCTTRSNDPIHMSFFFPCFVDCGWHVSDRGSFYCVHAVFIHHVDQKCVLWSSLFWTGLWSLRQWFVTMLQSTPLMLFSSLHCHNQR